MTLRWLRPFVAGAAVASGAWLLSYWYAQWRLPTRTLVIEYKRNTGPLTWPVQTLEDRGREKKTTTQYVAAIASKCRLPAWTLKTNEMSSDVDETAWLRAKVTSLSDAQLNCLQSYVQPPFLRLISESAN